jgi:Nickel responsive protein SCO4226-like
MAHRARVGERRTFLVEHYRPGLTVGELRLWAERVRDCAAQLEGEGKAVRYVRSAIVPADESLLCVLEAATEELVRETYARAGIPFERLSRLIPEGEPGWAANTTDEKEEG